VLDIRSLKMFPMINGFEGEENAKKGHPLYRNHVKHSVIDQSLWGNPHSSPEILPVGHNDQIAGSRIKGLTVTKDANPLGSILEECGNRGPEKG
jgi:hypothetical protein